MHAIKRGSDKPIDILRVRMGATGDLLPDAVVTWKFCNRGNDILQQGAATLIDATQAWFQFLIPKTLTAALDLMEHYRLDIIYAHSGKEIAYSYELIAVDYYAPT